MCAHVCFKLLFLIQTSLSIPSSFASMGGPFLEQIGVRSGEDGTQQSKLGSWHEPKGQSECPKCAKTICSLRGPLGQWLLNFLVLQTTLSFAVDQNTVLLVVLECFLEGSLEIS